MPWISKQTSNNKFYYYDSQNGLPLLLDLHGFGVTAESHYKNVSYVLEDFARIIVPEIPLHGNLIDIKASNLDEIVNYIADFIDTIFPHEANINIIGRSIGGRLAIKLLGVLEDRVGQVFVIESPVLGYVNSFTLKFRIISKFLIYSPKFILKPFYLIKHPKEIRVFFNETDYKNLLKVLRKVEPMELQLFKKVSFIYAKNDLYLSKRNLVELEKHRLNLKYNEYVAHFKNSTDSSIVKLVKSRLISL